jgi:hypothetical protein
MLTPLRKICFLLSYVCFYFFPPFLPPSLRDSLSSALASPPSLATLSLVCSSADAKPLYQKLGYREFREYL